MSSLFRIDKNSIIAQESKTAGFVVLPRFEEMIQKTEKETTQPKEEEEQGPAAEAGEKKKEDELEKKKRQLASVQKQIEQARAEAAGIIEQAKQEAQELKQQAVKEGFHSGYAKAQAEAAQARKSEKQTAAEAIEFLAAAKDSLYAEMENGVLDLAKFIAEHIIKTELRENDEAYKNIVRNLLTTLKNQSSIVLKTSKEDYERFFSKPDSDIAQELANAGIRVVQDMNLRSGDCQVETEYGCVNAGVKTQLNRLEYALKQIGAEI
jgi:flagellar assembly protein FliH